VKSHETPAGWSLTKLSEICDPNAPIMYGILQPGPVILDGVPYVRPSEIDPDRIRLEDIKRTTPEIAERYRRSTLQTEDLLITIVGTLGRIAVVPPELNGANITQSSARIRLNRKTANLRYIRQLLRSPIAIRQYDFHRLGTGVPRLNIHHVRDLQIPLPPLSEQKRIAEILDRAEALRAKRRAALALLDELTQSIFLDMFGDPVSNPKGWPVESLSDLGKITTGGTPSSKKEGMFGGTVPFVTPGDLESDELPKRTLSDHGASEAKTVPAGATFVCCIGATIGKMGQASVRSAFNQQLNAIEWSNSVNDDFGLGVLRFFKKLIATWGASTTLPILKKSSFEKIEIPVPPIESQAIYADRKSEIEQLRSLHRNSLSELDQLFASLQHRAFRGEL